MCICLFLFLSLHLSVSSFTVWQHGLDLLFPQTSLQHIGEILNALTFCNNSSLSHLKIRTLPPSCCSPSSVTNHSCFIPDFLVSFLVSFFLHSLSLQRVCELQSSFACQSSKSGFGLTLSLPLRQGVSQDPQVQPEVCFKNCCHCYS